MNYWILLALAIVLVLTGLLGFLLPPDLNFMSGAAPYNVFHIFFGLLGLALVATGQPVLIRAFNIGFGFLDLYQAAASRFRWFPVDHFRWKPADDFVHELLGAVLVAAGLLMR